MKRLLLTLLLLIGLASPALAAPTVAYADSTNIFENTCDSATKDTEVCEDVNTQKSSTKNPIVKIVKIAINVISIIVGAASIIGILAASLKMIAANGDANAVASARSAIAYCLVGVLVVVVSQAIIVFVLSRVT